MKNRLINFDNAIYSEKDIKSKEKKNNNIVLIDGKNNNEIKKNAKDVK